MFQYKGLKGVYERLIVSDAQVDRQIDALLEQHTRAVPVTDRPSQPGDELVLDYAGFCEGEQFQGGTAENQTLVLGSGAFIPGFEEQLVGARAGDSVEVRVTFPTPYHSEALAGKPAVFKCAVRQVRLRQKYAPDDVFAREVGGVDSFPEFREALRRGMQAYADRQADEDLKLSLLDRLTAGMDEDFTPEQLDRAAQAQLEALEGQLARQGLTLDAYCQFMDKTRDQLKSDMLPDARKGLMRQRAIGLIAKSEHIRADEDSVAEAIRQICRENGLTPEQLSPRLDESAQRAIVQNVITQKALEKLKEYAIIETVEKRGD